jgi:hypothetical protein
MYIDPGAGSLILQALAAAVLSVGLAFRRTRETVSHAFHALLCRLRRR